MPEPQFAETPSVPSSDQHRLTEIAASLMAEGFVPSRALFEDLAVKLAKLEEDDETQAVVFLGPIPTNLKRYADAVARVWVSQGIDLRGPTGETYRFGGGN